MGIPLEIALFMVEIKLEFASIDRHFGHTTQIFAQEIPTRHVKTRYICLFVLGITRHLVLDTLRNSFLTLFFLGTMTKSQWYGSTKNKQTGTGSVSIKKFAVAYDW